MKKLLFLLFLLSFQTKGFADNRMYIGENAFTYGGTQIILRPITGTKTSLEHYGIKRVPRNIDCPILVFLDEDTATLSLLGNGYTGWITYEIIDVNNSSTLYNGQWDASGVLSFPIPDNPHDSYLIYIGVDEVIYEGCISFMPSN